MRAVLLAGLLIPVLVVAQIKWGLVKWPWQSSSGALQEKVLEEPAAPVDKTVEERFIKEMNDLIATSSSQIAVDFIDLKNGQEYQFNAQEPFLAASTIKTLVATYALKKIQDGEISEKQPLGDYDLITQVKFMMKVSSNDSWELLNNFFGLGNIERFAHDLGMRQVDLGKNLVSAADLAILLQKLYKGQILNDQYSQLLFSYMQETETEDRIPAGLPHGVKVYHKSGTFADVLHDSGIISGGKRPFVLVVLIAGDSSAADKTNQIVTITSKAWQFANH